MKIYYKIMDWSEKGPKTLFHANNGSKVIPIHQWVEASKYELVSDGSGTNGDCNTQYMSGWHIFEDYEEAKKYLYKNFKKIINKLIVKCFAFGDIRRKEHSRGDVWLAQNIYLDEVILHQKDNIVIEKK